MGDPRRVTGAGSGMRYAEEDVLDNHAEISGNAQGGARGRLPRHEGGRPISMVGGRLCTGNQGLGGSTKQGHVCVSGKYSAARPDQGAAYRFMELRALRRALQGSRPVFLYEE